MLQEEYLFLYFLADHSLIFAIDSVSHQLLAIGTRNQLLMEQKRCIFKQTRSFAQNLP